MSEKLSINNEDSNQASKVWTKTPSEIDSTSSETTNDDELLSNRQIVRDVMLSTWSSRINNRVASLYPDLYETVEKVKSQMYYDSEEDKPSKEEIDTIINSAAPILSQYSELYKEAEEQLNAETKHRRIDEREKRKIYNYLHKDENERLRKRRSVYSAYDLSGSKEIPEEFAGLTFAEVEQMLNDKTEKDSANNIFQQDSPDTIEKGEKNNEEKVAEFYEDLDVEKEQRHPEAVLFFESMDWQKFPQEIKPNTNEQESQESWSKVRDLQLFGQMAIDNPPDRLGMRDVGADERLLLGDKYNDLTSTYVKVFERNQQRAVIPTGPSKGFCHALSDLVTEYDEYAEVWKMIGQDSLAEALDAYSDIYGVTATLDRFQDKIPDDDKIDRYTVVPIINEINNIVRQDWQEKITKNEDYKEGKPYSLLCGRVKTPFVANQYRNEIFSCSLLTDKYHNTIGEDGLYGFVFPPENIIATAPYDLYTHNWSPDDEFSLRNRVPVIMSYERVLHDSEKNNTYSEVITRDMPTGIFYLKDRLNKDTKENLQELIHLNPTLPVIAL